MKNKEYYAVEVYDKNHKFDRQIDIFKTYHEARMFKASYNGYLYDGEYLGILKIDCDKNGNEISIERL